MSTLKKALMLVSAIRLNWQPNHFQYFSEIVNFLPYPINYSRPSVDALTVASARLLQPNLEKMFTL